MGQTLANGLDELSWETCESPRHLLRFLRTRTDEFERWDIWFGSEGTQSVPLKVRWVIFACIEQLAGPSPSRRIQKFLDLAEEYLETPFPTSGTERQKVRSQLQFERRGPSRAIAQALTISPADGLGKLREAVAHKARACAENKDETERVFQAAIHNAARVQSDIIRDVFGNPFYPPPLTLSYEKQDEVERWLARNDGTASKLVAAMEDDHQYDQIPILADALEEAGCDDVEILDHCRNGKIHVRGCWVVRMLLECNSSYTQGTS